MILGDVGYPGGKYNTFKSGVSRGEPIENNWRGLR